MAVDPVITAVFGEPPEDIDLTEDSASQDKEAVLSLFVLSVIAVLLRLYARVIQQKKPFWDDWVIIFCLAFTGGTAGMSIAGGIHGAGRHVWALTISDVEMVFKILFAYLFMYGGAVSTSKISILLFYQRVFVTQNIFFRISIAIGYFLSFSYVIIIYVTTGAACRPVSQFWMQFSGAVGYCIDTNKFFFAMGIVNMLCDFYILIIPIPQILALKMSLKKRLAITGIMMLGGFVCAASAVRIYYLTKLINTVDVSGAMGPLFIWSDLEPAIAIVSACLPHLMPLRHVVTKKIATRFGSSNEHSRKSSGHIGGEGPSNASGPLYTYGGSRFGGGKVKLVDADDEIQLTTRVGGGKGANMWTRSNSAEDVSMHQSNGSNDGCITVQSSFVQTASPAHMK